MVAQTGKNKGALAKAKTFFRGVKAEIKKVNWPNKKELGTYTTVVLVTCALVSFVVWVLDIGIHELLELILG
ncbi:preprotein translocase subunit SecE [Caldisalinibacter kiritimatiensis]|uniref:Protein translocase subunit SecE n=1 Tax=Caldisalinibacter kiritimatiensis TaxID=1304284 RepID=R1AWG5_9FIRM|nr:preprotein translocase subunit SecE [Caldisalinibacter kiritimatiensis]EOD01488.1 Preprotein translocase subunit SecE [Caldisalinibacter kiritimatiensis]